jgi:predicted permease
MSVGVLLLVACANVANLFLVRSEARHVEVAVRRSLGADRGSMVRYFLSESLILAGASTAIGLSLAWIATRVLVVSGPATLPRLHEVQLDGYAALFTAAIGLAAGVVLGAIPLLRKAPRSVTLHAAGRDASARGGRFAVRQLLVGAQVALALVLLAASALMARSFQNLRSIDPGFDPRSTLTFRLGLPAAEYPTHDRVVATHRAIVEGVRALPGVQAVAAANCLPLERERCVSSPLVVDGRPLTDGVPAPGVWLHGVTQDYFAAMGMRVERGRQFEPADMDGRQPVVVINRALAARYFPDEDPLGQRVKWGTGDVWGTIVGIVSDTPGATLIESARAPDVYTPMALTDPDLLGGPNPANVSYVVRTSTPPLGLLASVRQAIGAIDRNLAVAQPRTLQDIVNRASSQMAFTMVLLVIAAGVALVLGLVGIYGATAYVVSQRAGEIGVRVALGARPGHISAMILRQGGTVASIGVGIGFAAALGTGRFLESLLYGVRPNDPVTLAAVIVLLLGASLLACWLPARRAARLDPVEALRAP